MKREFTFSSIALIGAMLFSCQVTTSDLSQIKPDILIPQSWQTRLESTTTAHDWVAKFNDPQLTKIVNEALRNNNSLKASAERVKQLEAAEHLIKASQRPGINAGAGLSTSGDLGDYSLSDDVNYSLSLSSRWEIDLWGRLRNQREQTQAETAAGKANYYATRLSLAANTCRAYFNLVSAQNSLALAEETLVHFQRSFKITERNYKAGIPGTDALDVQFGRNNIASAQRNLSAAKLNVTRTSQAVQILLGRYPAGTLRAAQELPSPIASLPRTLPQGVIEQRPDLIQARAELYASAKEIQIREKAFLPSLSLSPGISNAGTTNSLSNLLDLDNLSWSIASSLSQVLFDNGERDYRVQQTQSQYRAAIHNYSQDMLVALQEVEFALISDKSLTEQTALLQQEVRVSGLAETQAQRNYTEGLENADILSVLESQRRAVNARSGLIRIRNARLQNQVDLFVAMGGNPK